MREVRLQKLQDLVLREGSVEVDTIARELDVSKETIRRDLSILAERGLVHRTRGGATAPGGSLTELDLSVRQGENHAEKVAIARYVAARLVEDGMSVALDTGTTTIEIARALRGRRITVVTASLPIVNELAGTATSLVVIGGTLRPASMSMVGPLAEHTARQFQCDLALVSGPALRADIGLMDTDMDAVAVKQSMLSRADARYAVLDRSKLGRTAFATVCGPEELTGVVTDAGGCQTEIEPFADAGMDVRLAPTMTRGTK